MALPISSLLVRQLPDQFDDEPVPPDPPWDIYGLILAGYATFFLIIFAIVMYSDNRERKKWAISVASKSSVNNDLQMEPLHGGRDRDKAHVH